MSGVFLPALQGRFGDWIYYASLMKLSEISQRVTYANEIYKNPKLSQMIQRALDDKKRAADIDTYLRNTDDRFFNSLVLGVHGAMPQWHPFDITFADKSHSPSNLPASDRDMVGYLELSGGETLFALDGQHRLAGIKRAIRKDADLGEERISILFVPHVDTPAGIRRTRSLFVAINKKAVPVAKRDIIALDEVDLAAIVVRQIVDEAPMFARGQVDLERFTASIPAGAEALTTIGNFYDVVKIVVGDIIGNKKSAEQIQGTRIRLPEARIKQFTLLTRSYLEKLVALDPELLAALSAKDYGPKVMAGRERDHSRLLFRPIGLTIMTKVIAALKTKHSLDKAFSIAKRIPLNLSDAPFAELIWDPKRNRMITSNAQLCVSLLLYMLGESQSDPRLRTRYAQFRGVTVDKVRLPPKFK
jgi:DNA sulfur modification protein DndB